MRVLRQSTAAVAVASFLASVLLAGAGQAANGHANYHAVCPSAANDEARCYSLVVTDERGNPNATTAPTGPSPQDFWSAYNLPATTAGSNQTIAIVDAFDYKTAENDLNVFSAAMGLPACTTANGCFTKVNQNGSTNIRGYRSDQGWALEAALDIETAHGICPNCKIILVEAKTNSFANLTAAVQTAAALGANVISNSYGGGEFSLETSSTYGGPYNQPGIAVTVSSGDSGYGAAFPAASPYVTAVGGTTLQGSSSTGWSETAWSGAGSGCSAFVSAPSWQTSVGCAGARAIADVAADADPASGASVYDSTSYQGQSGWFRVGGTSLAAPLIGGVYALAGNASSTQYPVSLAWSNPSSLHDITSGSNGSCSPSQLCTARTGWDGPTGWGTPSGTGGF